MCFSRTRLNKVRSRQATTVSGTIQKGSQEASEHPVEPCVTTHQVFTLSVCKDWQTKKPPPAFPSTLCYLGWEKKTPPKLREETWFVGWGWEKHIRLVVWHEQTELCILKAHFFFLLLLFLSLTTRKKREKRNNTPLSSLVAFLLRLAWTNSHEGSIFPRGDLHQMGTCSAQVGVFEQKKFRKCNSKGWTATCHITKYSKTFLLNSFTSQL